MKQRIITAIFGLMVLFVSLCVYWTPVFNVIVFALNVIAAYEIITAFRIRHSAWLYAIVLPIDFVLVVLGPAVFAKVAPWLLFAVVFYLMLLTIFFEKKVQFFQTAEMLLFCAVALYGLETITSFRRMYPFDPFHNDALYLVLMGFGYAWGGDSMAYFVGIRFGRHKLAPEVSPHKTIEGALGGCLGSVGIGLLFTWIYGLLLPVIEPGTTARIPAFSYLMVVVFGVLASIFGIFGDLFASAVKRQCGIKDYGFLFPGHGGLLDRFDSVILVMPFTALVCRSFQFIVR